MNYNPSEYSYISKLQDDQLISIYGACCKALKEREMLGRVNKIIKNLSKDKGKTYHQTPEHLFDYKLCSHHSILLNFLEQDWSYLFSSENLSEEKKYYVYYHSDPSFPDATFKNNDKEISFKGRPFYVGKGTGERYKSRKRARSHLSVIKRLEKNGYSGDQIFHIFKEGLCERDALELEAKLIILFWHISRASP